MTTSNTASIVSNLDPAQVKVLVIPLNKFSDKFWQKYLKQINEFKQVSLTNLQKQNEVEGDDVILKKLGGVGGFINYNFITSIDQNSKDFIDFQLHQRIFGVIGLIYGEEGEIEVEEVLKKTMESIPNEVSTAIFCVEPKKEICTIENCLMINNSSDLKEAIESFTLQIMETMSKLFKEIHQRPSIPSPCGIEDYSGTASRSSATPKMRLSGRVQKLVADLHLLTGSFSDAVACYVSATEDAKVTNDSIWNAAAQEGFNLALCLQNEQIINDDQVGIYKLLIDKLTPLAIIYERSGTPFLSINLQITCSRVHRFIHQGTQALSVLSEAWKSCNLLAFDEKVVAYHLVLGELALAGNWRKWSLYMVQLAQTLKTAQKPEIALMTLSKTLSIYNLERPTSGGGWPTVQSALLKEMVKLSETHSNRLLYFLYGWMYLSHCNRWQDPSDQVQIIETLRKRSMRDMFSLNSTDTGRNNEFICSLPIFNRLELETANDGLFESVDKSASQTKTPFIYNPNAKSLTSSSTGNSDLLLVNEAATFKLILNNPFLFPITLRNIYLLTDSSDDQHQEQEHFSVTLPPMTKDRQISINFMAKSAGKIKILGFCSTFMNVEIQFLINSKGKILFNENEEIGMEFKVIGSQTILKCSSEDLQKGLQIFEGESIEIPLNFQSTGTRTKINFKIVEDTKISFDSDFEINEIILGNEKETTFKIESLPNEFNDYRTVVPLKVFGTFSNLFKTGKLEIFYASASNEAKDIESSVYWRKLVFPLSVTISPILNIEQVSFFPLPKNSNFSSSSSSILSKYQDITDSSECCVGTFIISNLDSWINVKCSINVINLKHVTFEDIPAQSSKRIFFLIPRLERMNQKLPLSEKQIALVRKLRRPGINDDFLDDTFQDFIYDYDNFWIKKYLIENLEIGWEMFDDQMRSGKVSLIQCEVPKIYHETIFKDNFIVQTDENEFKNVKIGQEILITIKIQPEEGKDKEKEKDYKLKLIPVVLLNDKKVALNFDKVIKCSGCLDSIVRGASFTAPQLRSFKFYPIATAKVKIVYHVTEIGSGKVHWCKEPIIIDTTELI